MTDEQKRWIDNANYEVLLERWRFAPVGDPLFIGETGDYYARVMGQKRLQDEAAAVAASKRIGFER